MPKSKFRCLPCAFLCLGIAIPTCAHAQFKNAAAFYADAKKGVGSQAAIGDDLFSESVNLQDGATSFSQSDVSLKTNSKIPVIIGRKFPKKVHSGPGAVDPASEVFGNSWILDVPYMMGTFDTRDGWVSLDNNGQIGGRCSAGTFAPRGRTGPWPYYYTTFIGPENFWNGTSINVPGYGQEQLLVKTAQHLMPADGQVYYGTTRSNWRVGCLPSIKNGSGEGFVVLMPDGVKYYFDWMMSRKVADLTDGQGAYDDPWHLLIPRSDVFLYATKAEDRFGNWVKYHYDPVLPQRLLSVTTNDGLAINLAYGTHGKISAITANGRSWSYEYVQENPSSLALSKVTLPDQSSWTYAFNSGSTVYTPGQPVWSTCSDDVGNLSTQVTIDESTLPKMTIGHPSGAIGEFMFRGVVHGTNNTPGECIVAGSFESGFSLVSLGVPRAYSQLSLVKKTISGPGVAARTWSYKYFPSWSFAKDCGNGCPETSETQVIDSDGVVRKLVYGNSYSKNAGQLLSESIEKAGAVYRTATYSYMLSSNGQPFPDVAGTQPKSRNNPFAFKNLPLISKSLTQDGAVYSEGHSGFDALIRPSTTSSSNTLGSNRTTTTEYHDNLSLWVLGQVKKQTTLNASPNGQTTTASMTSTEVEYNAQALPWKTYKFGKLQQILSYWPDGSVNTVTDGRGNVTWLGDYSRGIPRLIGHPDGTTESASVDGNGWITSVTDEIGAKTCYGYDAMGRVSSITYPSETQLGVCDTSRWHQTTIATEFINTAEHGIAAGHWRTALRNGPNAHINTYYDAMLRPVLEEKLDLNNIAGTLSQVVKRYDSSGRLSFQSYPTTNVGDAWAVTQGVRTSYDALDRVTRVEQDSEFGALATTTEYLPGLKTRVTNPRGFQTTTEYMAWDQPSYDLPILSQQPEGKTIQIARHPQFGWPLSLTQRNAANTLSQTRRYVYDGNAQMCKTIEPETGATVTGYDAAGNPAWSAAGLIGGDYANALDCSYTAANGSGRVVNRSYDLRNRLSTLSFPDGRGNQIWTYANDGLPASITTYNDPGNATPVVNAYTYNNRRLLTGESVSQPGWYTWGLGYGYDAVGNLSNQTYPTGLNIDYAPNALGQPTKAGTYASGAQYYPNGALKQFTYGNGIVHTMTQNARQLPQRVTSSGGALDYSYVYDANGNPEHIANELTAGYDLRDRWMTYDGLDRLTDAGSASFGGDHWHRFTYDALDNMKSWKLGGVKDYAEYVYDNATNRLTNIRNTAGATVVGFGYDPQGNLNNKNGQGYDFDYGNRLRSVIGKEYYRYDGLGRRVLAWEPTTNSIMSQYSQAGQVLYQENHRTSVASEHVYLAGSLIVTRERPFASSTITPKYQHTDALGSPVAVTNASGAVIDRNDYEPYGAIIGKPNYGGIGYTGHVMDGTTGLTYMQQRYYDQSIGRFLSVDPVTADAKVGANFNRYWYANDNPYKFVDPDGRQSITPLKSCHDTNSCMTSAQFDKAFEGEGMKFMKIVTAPAVAGATGGVAVEAGAVAVTVNAVNRAAAAAEGAYATTGVAAYAKSRELAQVVTEKANVMATKANEIRVAIITSPVAVKAMQQMENLTDTIEGYFNPGPPPMSPAGVAAGYVAGVKNEVND